MSDSFYDMSHAGGELVDSSYDTKRIHHAFSDVVASDAYEYVDIRVADASSVVGLQKASGFQHVHRDLLLGPRFLAECWVREWTFPS